MSEFRKLSDKISIDDSGINEVFLVNGQWQFTLPDGLSYEIDGEFTFIEGGFDLSGSTKPLVLRLVFVRSIVLRSCRATLFLYRRPYDDY